MDQICDEVVKYGYMFIIEEIVKPFQKEIIISYIGSKEDIILEPQLHYHCPSHYDCFVDQNTPFLYDSPSYSDNT